MNSRRPYKREARPRVRPTDPDVGFVYFARVVKFGGDVVVKVGTTIDVRRRLGQIGTKRDGTAAELLAAVPGGYDLERAVHEFLAPDRWVHSRSFSVWSREPSNDHFWPTVRVMSAVNAAKLGAGPLVEFILTPREARP